MTCCRLCCVLYAAVPVKEIYFISTSSEDHYHHHHHHHEPSSATAADNKYYYYTTELNRSRDRGSQGTGSTPDDDTVGGPRVDTATSRLRQLTVTESVPSTLHCIAAGGYPAPRLRMLVGDRDVTERFRRKATRTLRGVVGMRVIDIRSELYSDEFSADADDDDAIVRCTAFVDRQLGEQFAAISLHVRRTYYHYHYIT